MLAYDEDDFYSVWYHGRDITIAGQTVNRAIYPNAKIVTEKLSGNTVLSASLDDDANGGILFFDTSSLQNPTIRAAASSVTLGKDKIIIGRHKSANQPVMRINKSGAYSWILDGKVMMKNITLSSFQTTRPLIAGKDGSAHGMSEFYFEDCTLTCTASSYGIFYENTATWAVPSTMRFDNCILRSNAEFFSAAGKGTGATTATSAQMVSMQNLKSLEFNNCVFAPATIVSADNTNGEFTNSITVNRLIKNGALVALYNINHYFDDLDITCTNCTFYDMGAAVASRGLIDVTSIGNVKIENTIFYNSAIAAKTLLCNAVKMCTSASLKVTASYYHKPEGEQDIMAGGSASNIKGNPADASRYSVSFSVKADMFGTPEPNKHYFPTLIDNAGASYDTKYWIVPTLEPSEEPTQTPE